MEKKINSKIDPSLFEPAEGRGNEDAITRPSISYWKDVGRRLRKNKLAMTGLVILILLILLSIIGPKLTGFGYADQNYLKINARPDKENRFGTDELGRDLFTRVCYGVRYSLIIGFLSAVIVFAIGVLYGGIAAMSSSKVDAVMMRIAEVIYSIPYMLIVILISVTFSNEQGASLLTLVIAMTITGRVPTAILVRGQVLQLRENEYAMAAVASGAGKFYILRKHMIPNTLGPILVSATLMVPRAIFSEANLSFMGLGLQPPQPSLGTLSNDGLAVMGIGLYYQMAFPAIAISLIMFSFNVLGDGLRDALDPKLRQ